MQGATWNCGHERTQENTAKNAGIRHCRTCLDARLATIRAERIERDESILAEFREGKPLEDIGARYRLSVSRVRCILRDMGVSFATFRGDLLMPQRALELAAREANSTVSELVSPERLRHLYTVRYAYMAAMTRHGLSTPRIGRRLRRDHTTILHGLKRANELAERSPQFAALVERLAAA